MHSVVFEHIDKDLSFRVSSIPWDDSVASRGGVLGAVPEPTLHDQGKVLVINKNGQPIWRNLAVEMPSTDMKNFAILDAGLGSPEANLNALPQGFNVKKGEFWTVTDEESGTTYLWNGGPGLFGYKAGGEPVTHHMFMGIGAQDVIQFAFATDIEARKGQVKDKAISPLTAKEIDLDGGIYE